MSELSQEEVGRLFYCDLFSDSRRLTPTHARSREWRLGPDLRRPRINVIDQVSKIQNGRLVIFHGNQLYKTTLYNPRLRLVHCTLRIFLFNIRLLFLYSTIETKP